MNRYWDLAEKQRAELSSEQVEAMLDTELMEQGVVRIEAPAMLPVDVPEIPSTTMYVIKVGFGHPNYAYKTAEDAAVAMSTAVPLDGVYIGGDYRYCPKPQGTLSIEPLAVHSAADVANNRKAAEQAAANKKANEKATSDYKLACKAVDEVCQGVWDDWHKCRALANRYRKVIATLAEYRTICDGDDKKAMVFLAKAFPQPDIDAAREWYGATTSA